MPRAACKALSRSGRRLAGINNQLGRVGCRNVARQGDLPLSTSIASSKVTGGWGGGETTGTDGLKALPGDHHSPDVGPLSPEPGRKAFCPRCMER